MPKRKIENLSSLMTKSMKKTIKNRGGGHLVKICWIIILIKIIELFVSQNDLSVAASCVGHPLHDAITDVDTYCKTMTTENDCLEVSYKLYVG